MSEQEKNGQLAAQGGTTPGPGEDGQKTFSQEDVNRIVTERLARERSKSEATILQREQELARKEFLFEARQTLTEKGLSPDLLDALNTSSPEAFNASLAILEQQLEHTKQTAFTPPPMYAAGTGSSPMLKPTDKDAEVRRAMGLKR